MRGMDHHAPSALARVIPPATPLSLPRLLVTAVKNPLEVWPQAVYEQPLYRRSFASREIVFVSDPEMIKTILVDEADAFEKAEAMQRSLEPALGKALLTADGAHWRWQRRAAAPIFRHERILGFAPAMIAAAERTRDRWLAQEGQELDVAHEMMLTTYDIIVETMLSGGQGIEAARVEQAVTDYLDPIGWVIAMSLVRLPRWLPFPGKRRSEAARLFIRHEILRLVAERRASGEDRNDLIGLLLAAEDPETGQAMNDRDLADNILTFITAGHETTALALTWTFYLLDRHPEAADRIRAEVEAVTSGGPITSEHVGGLGYTRQVLQEAMRLYPPAAIVVRGALRDVAIGRARITAGTQVYVPIYAVHRHAALWDEPDRFDPQRFAPEAAKVRHRYAYLPFGAGPRICIGMSFAMIEAVLILATLVRAARPVLRPGFTPEPRLTVTLRPTGGMPMRLHRIGS
jgi:cytochrome P450